MSYIKLIITLIYITISCISCQTKTTLKQPKTIQENKNTIILINSGYFFFSESKTKIWLDSFYIDKYETTVREYQTCMKHGVCTQQKGPDTNWMKKQQGNHTMGWVTWEQAKVYCQWKGKRLPTEKEWEKAAQGPYSRLYPWGDSFPHEKKLPLANLADISIAKEYGPSASSMKQYNDTYFMASPVGALPLDKSPYGVYDMGGNVSEWVEDTFFPHGQPQIYKTSRKTLKGGNYGTVRASHAYISYRFGHRLDGHNSIYGFRCAKNHVE